MAIQLRTARKQRCSACSHHAPHPARSRRMQLVSRPPSDPSAIKRNTPHQKPGATPWCLPRRLHAAGSLCHDSMHRPHVSTPLTLTFRLAGLDKLCQHSWRTNPLWRSPVHAPRKTAQSAPAARLNFTCASGMSDHALLGARSACKPALEGGCQRGTNLLGVLCAAVRILGLHAHFISVPT
jgi:hypothetical protein